MFILMLLVFLLGYGLIVFEHINEINKAAIALIIGATLWAIYALGAESILALGYSQSWNDFLQTATEHEESHRMLNFITEHELLHHLSEIASVVLFLLGAMTVVEVIDQYQGFRIIISRIKTTNIKKLLWLVSFLTFFMSAVLDNLTTTIVMVTILSKIISNQKNKWLFAGMVVIAANSGGAFSPIGDVTTIMLWIGGQITAANIISGIFIPSLISMVVPLVIMSFFVKGTIANPVLDQTETEEFTTHKERVTIFTMGIGALVFVPIFKTTTHLPPFLGVLLGLGIMWLFTDRKLRGKLASDRRKLCISSVMKKVDIPTIMFFLGILSGVAALQSAGHLDILASFLDEKFKNVYTINIIIGVLSAVVDNVPLVAASMGMYDISTVGATGYAADFIQNGSFWTFLAYCAGTGGSILIIGSAAGVAAMGIEKINFVWYIKHVGWIAAVGYLAGAGAYILMQFI